MNPVEETHQQGLLSIENLDEVLKQDRMDCDVGIQIAHDGRIWLCVNGLAFIRFKPKRKSLREIEDRQIELADLAVKRSWTQEERDEFRRLCAERDAHLRPEYKRRMSLNQ